MNGEESLWVVETEVEKMGAKLAFENQDLGRMKGNTLCQVQDFVGGERSMGYMIGNKLSYGKEMEEVGKRYIREKKIKENKLPYTVELPSEDEKDEKDQEEEVREGKV